MVKKRKYEVDKIQQNAQQSKSLHRNAESTDEDIFYKSGKIVAASVVIRVFVCYNDRNRVGGSELASAGDTGS